MRSFVLLACLALAVAKPQGYSYSGPGAGLAGSSSNQGIVGLAAPGHHGGLAGAQSQAAPQLIAQQAPQLIAQPAPQLIAQPSFAPAQVATTTIQKHIYVHIPPADSEEAAQVIAPAVNHQKHYKIIFIKAPSAPSIAPQLLQQQQQISEEKTLVYVLVKKPEAIVLPQQSQQAQQTSKPEVFFIKYKTEKEQGAAAAPLGIVAPGPVQSAPLSIAGPAPLSLGGGASDNSLLSLGSSPSAASSLIQPRNPSPIYGPAH